MANFNEEYIHTKTDHIPRIRGDINTDPSALPKFSIHSEELSDCKPLKVFINNFRQRGIWGYVIFRTVYTPESERQFPLAIAKIERYLRSCLKIEGQGDIYFPGGKRFPAERSQLIDVVMRCFQNTIFEDPDRFNNKTEDDLAVHFKLWLADKEREFRGGAFGYRHFLVIDEKILSDMMAAPDDFDPDDRPRDRPANLKIVRVPDQVSYTVEAYQLWEQYNNGSHSHS